MGVSATSSQPISAALAGPTVRAGCAREHLCSEAHPEHGDFGGEDVLQEPLLAREPLEAVVLIRVLRAAEDHDGVVARRALGRAALGHLPADERVAGRLDGLVEHTSWHARAVGDREDAHRVTVESAGFGWPVSGYALAHVDRHAVHGTGLRDADDGAVVHRPRPATGTDLRARPAAGAHGCRREARRKRARTVCAEPQNSVGASGGGSMPPVAAMPASSRRPRRITALRGAKSSRLLLKSA